MHAALHDPQFIHHLTKNLHIVGECMRIITLEKKIPIDAWICVWICSDVKFIMCVMCVYYPWEFFQKVHKKGGSDVRM